MSEPFRLQDLPKEVQLMVWEVYFHPFDIEIIQHSHTVDGVEAFESTVHGFGPAQDLSILRASSQISKDVQGIFEKAFSGKLSILGCQYCLYDDNSRLPQILNIMPSRLLRFFFDNTSTDDSCQDSCGNCTKIQRDPARLFEGIDLSRFPMLEEVRTGIEARLEIAAIMEQEFDQLRSARKSNEDFMEEDALTARERALQGCLEAEYAETLFVLYGDDLTEWCEATRYRCEVADNVAVVMEFFEERDNNTYRLLPFGQYLGNIDNYLVSLVPWLVQTSAPV